MEAVIKKGILGEKYRDLSFRRAFILTVFITFTTVICLSAAGILGCVALRNHLLPDPNAVILKLELRDENDQPLTLENRITLGDEPMQIPQIVFLTEDGHPEPKLADLSLMKVSVVKLEKSIDRIGPRRRLAYQACGVFTVLFPVLLSVSGILVCGFSFYRQKMERPLALLNRAVEKIASEDLDFTLEYESRDEMGRLCASFEKMRRVLLENHRTLWNMAEERRLLQASVAHDLRNPIAILAGYVEYLQLGLGKGGVSRRRLATIADRLEDTVNRLSQYTESVRHLNRMEDMEILRVPVDAAKFARKMTEDFEILASDAQIRLEAVFDLPRPDPERSDPLTVAMDRDVVYRVAENLMNNALRFAREKVLIAFSVEKDPTTAGRCFFTVEIRDDGPGFPEQLLKGRERPFPHVSGEKGHSGLGLTIAELLCKKHGGRLELSNPPSGALAKAFLGL